MLNLISDVLLKPYFDEKLRALKYGEYLRYAKRLLEQAHIKKTQQRSGRYLWKAQKGLGVLAELARNYPYRTQEVIDTICYFLRAGWAKQQPYTKSWNEVLSAGLRILASLPKRDQNQHPYYVELTAMKIEDLALKGINLENFVMWDTEFIKVNLTRSNFRNTDLGGCLFEATSVEWCDFSEALMNFSFLTERSTTFDRARLWGSKFDTARIDKCRMRICDGFNAQSLEERFKGKLEIQELPG